jgi:hypothetical protein
MGEVTLPSGYRVPTWDQWAVDLQADARLLLQARLLHCGGCDGHFGPEWSPTGRYLYFSELAGDGRTFLSDLKTGTTREIFRGHTDAEYEPDWAPASDQLLYPNDNGSTTFEDLPADSRRELPELVWPARFDLSGAFAYAPAWSTAKAPPATTTILDLHSGDIDSLPGRIGRPSVYAPVDAVTNIAGMAMAALEQAPGCDGTAVYVGATLRFCEQGAVAPAFSPDGSALALLRRTGDIGRYDSPSISALFGAIYEVVLVDLRSGAERVVATNVIGNSDIYPLPARWNDIGTHLLLQYPFAYGL